VRRDRSTLDAIVSTLTSMMLLDPNRPIGVFDSGVGGLTVLRALRQRLPHESMIYLGDTARLPYGTKSGETVERYAQQAADYLVDCGVKLLVVACNTASAHALPMLRRRYPTLPVVGVIESSAAAACQASASGRIAVIATEGTMRAGAYERTIYATRPEAVVRIRACSLLVALAEEGWVDDDIAQAVIRRYLATLFDSEDSLSPDCLVLGCTHFPLLKDAIAAVVGTGVSLIDSGAAVAEIVAETLAARQLATSAKRQPGLRLMATDNQERFAQLAARFLGVPVSPQMVELVALGVTEVTEPTRMVARAAL
jgi:glutamate racemase